MSDMRLVVVGAAGRMGRMLIRAIDQAEGCRLAAAIERPGSATLGTDAGVLAGVPSLGVAVTSDAVAAFARRTPIIRSGNMSLGVNLLAALVRKVAATLGTDWDIEIVEMHHRMKVDAPSGTAVLLGGAAAEGRGVDLAQHRVAVRDGITGAREPGTIGFAALRGGTVVGDHKVIFAGAGERLELAHVAEDRSLFAQGAVKAALWGRGRAPGLYSMADVLGLDTL